MLLGFVKKLCFVYTLATSLVGVIGLQATFHWDAHRATTTSCYRTFVTGLRNDSAAGIWQCLGPEMQQAMFAKNDWNGSKDIQRWLDHYHASGSYLQVQEFSGNPFLVCEPAANGGCIVNGAGAVVMWNAYLVYVTAMVKVDDGPPPIYEPDTQNASSLEVMIDSRGLIAAIQ